MSDVQQHDAISLETVRRLFNGIIRNGRYNQSRLPNKCASERSNMGTGLQRNFNSYTHVSGVRQHDWTGASTVRSHGMLDIEDGCHKPEAHTK